MVHIRHSDVILPGKMLEPRICISDPKVGYTELTCVHMYTKKARAYNSTARDSVLYKPFHLHVQIVAKPPKIFPFSVITLKQAPTPLACGTIRYILLIEGGGGQGVRFEPKLFHFHGEFSEKIRKT